MVISSLFSLSSTTSMADLNSSFYKEKIFNNHSSSPNMRPKAEWAIDSEAMRARGIINCFSKIQLVGQKYGE